MEKVDETINAICDWIQNDLKKEGFDKSTTEMIEALAALVSARKAPGHPMDIGISDEIARGVIDALNEETRKNGKSPLFI